MKTKSTVESKVRDIKRATKRKFSAEEIMYPFYQSRLVSSAKAA